MTHGTYQKFPVTVIVVISQENPQILSFSAMAFTVAPVVKLSSIITICFSVPIYFGISTCIDARALINRSFQRSSFCGRKSLSLIFSAEMIDVIQPKRLKNTSRNCTFLGSVGGVRTMPSTHLLIKNFCIRKIVLSMAEIRSFLSWRDFP